MRKCKGCVSISSAARYAESTDEIREKNRAYYQANKDRIGKNNSDRVNKNWSSRMSRLLSNSKGRAATQGFDHDIDFDFLVAKWQQQCGKCYYSGETLTLSGEMRVSLDRQDSSRGYTKDNVNLVCLTINYMKRDTPHEVFVRLCKKIGGLF